MKKITLFLMALCLSVTAMAQTSGTCGANLTWSYDASTTTLTITGTGAMDDYTSNSSPWSSFIITTVNLPSGLTIIGGGAFLGCSSLTSITIPNSVTTIGEGAFYYCDSLTSLTLGNDVTIIGERAFSCCESLPSITIPNSVTTIGEGAFKQCGSLTSIQVESGNNSFCSVDGVLFDKAVTTLIQYPIGNSQTTYTIPNSVTSIGDVAFYNCTSLASISIHNSVTTIGDWAFGYCSSLTTITLGNGVMSIGEGAFYYCNSLTSLTSLAATPPAAGGRAFYAVDKTIPVYVPVGSISAYEAAGEWKEFTNYQTLSNVQDILVEGKDFRVVDGSLLFGSDTQVAVFAVTGQVIFSGMTQSVQLPQAGVYVVRTEKGTAKIGVR